MSPLMYGSRSRTALVLRCGVCGRLPGRLGAYPTSYGVALCGHCAYARGMLSGKERAKYLRRHPLRAAFCGGTAIFKRLRAWWRLESRRMREQERFLCPHGRVICLPMIGADPCEGYGPDSENYRVWKKWSEEFDRAANPGRLSAKGGPHSAWRWAAQRSPPERPD